MDGDNLLSIKEFFHELTNSLIQHGPGNSMEDWVTDFSVQINFEVLSTH